MHTAARVTTQLLLAAAFAFAFAVPALTHTAPVAGYAHSTSPVTQATYAATTAAKPVNVPTWGSHGETGCQPLQDGVVPQVVLVVTQGGDTERMSFDAAWALGQDSERANDVWTVGMCQ